MDVILYAALGLVSGLLGGLLGIGGGVITVPVLYYLFQYITPLPNHVMQVAVSTSLAAGFITSAVSTYVQLRKGAVQFSILKLLIPGLIFGCIAGAVAAHFLSSVWLREIFGCMALGLGLYFFFPRLPHLKISSEPNRSLSIFGLGIGALSTLLGIGGGSLTFPVLLGYRVEVKTASATSSAATLFTTFLGSVAFLLIAWHQPDLPNAFGYIDLRAFWIISAATVLTAPIGVHLSHTLNVRLIKQTFGACLALIGLTMLFI